MARTLCSGFNLRTLCCVCCRRPVEPPGLQQRRGRHASGAQVEQPLARPVSVVIVVLLRPEETRRPRRSGGGGGGGGGRLHAAEDVGRHDQAEAGTPEPQDEKEPPGQPAITPDRDQPRQQRRLGRLSGGTPGLQSSPGLPRPSANPCVASVIIPALLWR